MRSFSEIKKIEFQRKGNCMNPFSLENKVAVVTGGFGLLGQNFTAALAGAGAKVAIVDVIGKPEKISDQLLPYLQAGQIINFVGDITKREDLQRILKDIQSKWDTPHILINNAAIDSPPSAPASENGPFEDYPEASFDRVMNVNVKGTLVACQVIGGAMAKVGRGSIINISSIYGVVSPNQDIYEFKRQSGENWFKPVAYSISKSAVLNLTRYLATYWAKKGVRVNTLTPSGIYNNQDERFMKEYLKLMPMGRMAKPDEMNGSVVFLASDASSYMTGSNLVVDGGWTAW